VWNTYIIVRTITRNQLAVAIKDLYYVTLEYLLNPPAAAPSRKAARATNLAESQAWNTYIIVRTITRNQLAVAIKDLYYATLDDPTKGSLPRVLINHICTTYALISQPETNDNMTKFHTGIEASLMLAVYTRTQEKCHMFALDHGVPITEATIATTGTKAALLTRSINPSGKLNCFYLS
jgi:hypothetical protein